MVHSKIWRRLTGVAVAVLALMPGAAHAQLSGHNLASDFGLKSGSQGPPGIYLTYLLYRYDPSEIILDDLEIDLPDFSTTAHVPFFSVVTTKMLWGANYGFGVTFPFVNAQIEAPRLDLDNGFWGFSDMWVQPISLGWHLSRADVTAWYAFTAPTGEYEPEGDENTGLGMWSHELALGTTTYLDVARTWHAAALGTLEYNSEKEGVDAQPGTVFTIEGGVGKTLIQILDVGLAYHLQWKLTEDDGLALPEIVQDRLGKNRNFGLGPEVGVVFPLSEDFKKLLIANLRYVFETGTKFDTNGNILVFGLTYKAR